MDSIRCGQELSRLHPVMQAGFVGLVHWALTEDGLRKRFEDDTGMHIPAASRSPIEAMIDKATGYGDGWAAAFIDWCWDTLW